ncbi:MAG: DUF262 domain-containing HNH endonuclease family protein [Gammaproteobacteria bacterium]|nr:DUF262 domain-containing HNH endonuclease family protein [Gammaproteobacteria bacterium]
MATIVCLRRDKIRLGTDDYEQLDIVDGQQRLTTLILLLNSIKLALDQPGSQQKRDHKHISELLVKQSNDLLLLQTNHDSSHYFADFLRDGRAETPDKGKTLADRELLAAISDCREFVKNWVEKRGEPLELLACIKNNLYFILHVISDEKLVYTVFEVLNSRGMEVSWLDRLKSMLMGKAYELTDTNRKQLISELQTIWRDIYKLIGLRQGLGTEALRFAATLYLSTTQYRPLNERKAVEAFRGSSNDAESIRKAAKWLLRVTQACEKVMSNPRQNAVTQISQARLLAVAIHLNDDIQEHDRDKLLAIWEKITFRIYGMMGNDARKRVGDYVRLACKVAKTELAVKEIHAEIRKIGKEFPIEKAVEKLRDADCYEGWENEFRYFMFRYEEHLRRKEGQNFKNEHWEHIWNKSPSKSIEHISPQKTAPDTIKHRLGNLMILQPELNSQLQDKKPEQKRQAYRDTGLLSAKEVASILESEPEWTQEAVKERGGKLLEWAAREWAD